MRLLRQHGMTRSTFERHSSDKPVTESYPVVGYNYRSNGCAGRARDRATRRLDDIIARRRAVGDRYRAGLEHLQALSLPADPPFGRTNYQSYIVRVNGAGQVQELMQKLQRRGIATRFGIMCAHREPPYSEQWPEGSLPESRAGA